MAMVDEIKIEKNEGDIERAFEICKAGWKPSTQEAYKVALNDFGNFCRNRGVLALPSDPQTVIAFLLARERTNSIPGLFQRLAVIRALHAAVRGWLPRGDPDRDSYTLDDPIITERWEEIKRRKEGDAVPKHAVRSEELEAVLREIPGKWKGTQDRAILCIGLAYALRRAEIVTLDLDDLEINDKAMSIRIRGSKRDQVGTDDRRTAPRTGTVTCPVAAIERWLEVSKITQGAVFKNRLNNRQPERYPNTIIKEYGAKARFDPEVLGGESLRKGSIFDRTRNGDSPETVMRFARVNPSRYFEYLRAKIAQVNDSEERDIAEIRDDMNLSDSERRTLIDARRGQGRFRDALLKRWDNECAVTGCTVLAILRASHIQPWSTSTKADRLNPANGLLLDANLDALFDKHLISFGDDGRMLIAPGIQAQDRQRLRVPGSLRKPLSSDEKRFLAQHRAAAGFSQL